MGGFMAKNLINGLLTWKTVKNNRIYKRFMEQAKAELDERGYMLDENEQVVKKPETKDANTDKA